MIMHVLFYPLVLHLPFRTLYSILFLIIIWNSWPFTDLTMISIFFLKYQMYSVWSLGALSSQLLCPDMI